MSQSQYLRINVQISASNIALIRKARTMLSEEGKDKKFRARRFSFYREMILHHEKARGLFYTTA